MDMKKRAELLPMLESVQKKYGNLPEKELKKLSEKTRIHLSEIFGVASFYSHLEFSSRSRHLIRICNSTPCYLNGSLDIIKFLEKTLKIKSGETTKDRRFFLEIGSCIGCCDKAPAMMINDKVYTKLTKESIKKILKKY